MSDDTRHDHSALKHLLRAVRRRIVVVLIFLIGVPAVALAISLLAEDQYTASASLLFRDPGLDEQLSDSTVLRPSTDPDREAQTNFQLISLDVVADRAARRLPPLTGEEISEKVVINSEAVSDVVSIEATDPDPVFAALLVNILAREYAAFRRDADRSKVREAQRLIERQIGSLAPSERAGGRGRSLQDRSEQLAVLAALQTGNAELVQEARPPAEPSSPNPLRNAVIGGLLGLALGLGFALLFELFDRRLRDSAELETIFARPVLTTVPESPALSPDAVDPTRLPPAEAEAFRMLRANLRYFNVDYDTRSLVVTSAASGEGKSTVAWNLAATWAESGTRTVLIEADLRRPSLAQRYGLTPSAGLSSVLAGQVRFDEAVHTMSLDGPSTGKTQHAFDVLFSGPLPPNPSDLLESDQMAKLLALVEGRYGMIVMDTPPVTVVADAVPLLSQGRGVIVVSRLGHSTRDTTRDLRRRLEHLGSEPLGVVANGARTGDTYYGGYGSYGLADAPSGQGSLESSLEPAGDGASTSDNGTSPRRPRLRRRRKRLGR